MNKVYLARGELPDRARSHALTLRLAQRLCQAAGWEEDEIDYLPSGKPVFRRPGLFLSACHTAGTLFVAVSALPVGLDAEKRRSVPKKVAARWFSPSERKRDFFEVWTTKEAVSKISGGGLSLLRQIEAGEKTAVFAGKIYSLYREEREGIVLTAAATEPFEAEWIE